ncbi:hypothetical protein PWYN_06115 [Paenibacillus wynnii]|uniref:Uncharacterized protein n=1 Tax=Paenibacillus wynnii TaxID=268407 RepID=A0A098MA90_9BACL|nr:hypothetical protein PWYN_06115 [Paenibacillus wynnii]
MIGDSGGIGSYKKGRCLIRSEFDGLRLNRYRPDSLMVDFDCIGHIIILNENAFIKTIGGIPFEKY